MSELAMQSTAPEMVLCSTVLMEITMRKQHKFNPYLAAPVKAPSKDSYVVVKLSHPKRKFSEKSVKEPKHNCQNLGFTNKKKFGRWTKNPVMPGYGLTRVEMALTVKE